MDSTELSYEIVWQKVDAQLTEELTEFWLEQKALPSREAAAQRAASVAIVARRSDGTIAGVSSVSKQRYPNLLNNMLYGYRSFVAPEYRRVAVGYELLSRVTSHLEEEFMSGRATECIGVMMVLENPLLATTITLAIDPRIHYIFIGTNERGHHMRVYWFEGAEVVRPTPGAAS